MIKQLFIVAAISLIPFTTLSAAEKGWSHRDIEVVDTPTADVVDHYGYDVTFRFYSEGTVQTKTAFGIFPRLNLGFGLDMEQLIGTDDARLNKPTINFKFRFFDGKGLLPALAGGFDGQGFQFDRALDEYQQREKGFFLVATSEFFFPDFLLNYGVNVFDFDKGDSTRGFVGASYTYQNTIGLLGEWDSLGKHDERRIGFGLKYFITPLFTVDLLGRDIPAATTTSSRELERVVRLGYTGSF